MNAIKTISALCLLSACTAGCAEGSKSDRGDTADQSSSSTDTSKTLPAGPTKSTTPVTPDEVIEFRGGERSTDTSDYAATDGKYRLYGVDGPPGAEVATIAELGTWTTRQYKVGDAFGRGLVVAKIDIAGVVLHGARIDVAMAIGADTDLRVIRHDLDVVAQPLGKHRFALSVPAARAALETNPARPAAEQVELYDQSMRKLGSIPERGLWAKADFREGDLLATLDGEPVGDDALAELETALTDGRPKVDVTIYRGGVALHRRYEVDAVR